MKSRIIFENFFKESNILIPTPDGLFFKKLSCANNRSIEEPFSEEEIKVVVWSCEGEKAQGRSSIRWIFIRRYWEVVKEEIQFFVRDFYVSAELVKAITTSFLALIPKVPNP